MTKAMTSDPHPVAACREHAWCRAESTVRARNGDVSVVHHSAPVEVPAGDDVASVRLLADPDEPGVIWVELELAATVPWRDDAETVQVRLEAREARRVAGALTAAAGTTRPRGRHRPGRLARALAWSMRGRT